MATVIFSSPHLILHRFILRRPTLPLTTLASQAKQSIPYLKATPFFSNSFRYSTFSPLSSPPAFLCSLSQQLENDVVVLENVQTETEAVSEGSKSLNLRAIESPPPPTLSVKEKKELASFAHGLGKKLKSQQVGKSGVTDTVVMALVETLEANELLKLKIHSSCPGELVDVVKQLEETTGSVAVGQIGRTVILYRPSMTKLKAEEKKKQNQRLLLKRQSFPKPFPKRSPQDKRETSEEQQQYGRGRRGSSRF